MPQLSNVPKQQTYLRLAKAQSFSLGLWFRTKDQRDLFGSPAQVTPTDGIDITDDTVRLVIYNTGRYGSAVVYDGLATLVEPESGYARVDMQAEDTDLAAREYAFSITWVSENYSGVVVQGVVEIVANGDPNSLAFPDYDINPPLTLGIELDERNHIQVVVDHMRAPDLRIGSVTTLAYGNDAQAYFTGAYPHQNLHLGIPRGPGGDPPTLEVGTVEVGDNENDAEVELVPDGPGAYLMNFVLPRANVDSVGGRVFLDAYPEVAGNNVTDDAVTIQAVLNAMDALGGGTLELGSKTYFVDSADLQVPDGVWVEGLGRDVSGFRLGVGRRIRVGVWGDGDRPGGLQKLFVDGNGAGHADGLVQFQSVFAQMLHCKVFDGVGQGVLLDAAQNAVIQGSYVTGHGGAALAIRNGSGGYNFLGSHFTNSARNLKIYDTDGSLNNAYPFGSAHMNFWGGIFEQYVDGEIVFEIRCSGALHFWGTGFSVNGAITMSEGCVGRVTNEDFPLVSTFVEFNGCTWNGGTNKYVGLEISGSQYVTFSGENYIQKHTAFVDVIAGGPRIQQLGFFSGGSAAEPGFDVDALFTASGGSLVNLYNEHNVGQDFIMPADRLTVLSSRIAGDAGHRYRLEASGKQVYNEGDDFGTEQYFEYSETDDEMLHTSVMVAGRFSLKAAATLFPNGAVNLDTKLRTNYQLLLTGTGHADNVAFTNPYQGAFCMVTVYATAGQSLTWDADILWHGGVAGPTAPAAGKTLNVLAFYDDVLDKWLARSWTDDATLAGALAPEPPGLAAHLADTTDTHPAASITGLSEAIDDRVDALIADGTGIRTTYDDAGNLLTIGAYGAGFNNQTGTSYGLVVADAGKWVTLANAAAITLTVPNSSTQAFTIGDEIDLLQAGNGQVTIAAAGGVTVANRGGRTKFNGLYAVAGLKYLGSNFWISYGDLTT